MAEPDSWADVEEFVAEAPKPALAIDKWAGEDEDDDVKDNWDDEEEEKREAKANTEVKAAEKKKKPEKVKAKKEVNEKAATEPTRKQSPEEERLEKLRLQKLQEEADLHVALETFGERSTEDVSVDALNPVTKEDFVEFGNALRRKVTQYEKSAHYVGFLEALFRDICISLEMEDAKKLSSTLNVLCVEKQKADKEKKVKNKKKRASMPGGGFKANLRDELEAFDEGPAGYDEYEDFM
ncbi:eukaryotic translation initiation factor 3 subunit J isoform X1 [Lethenteron reissneri]|uniref:eukaryotic translation initiation factor 3 subunit J isoform X1 n=1 Tax=Lethenteron reissneri TaxID=7753 RepID=UPI002AB74F1D|nr:eukaryotic translation initiation factor 3 subunit J isoform X1 [Lethenteron reissneri]